MQMNLAKLFITIRLYVWVISDSFICVSTHLCFCVRSIFLCETIRSRGTSQTYVMTLLYVWYDSSIYICVNPFIREKRFVPMVLLIWMSWLCHMCDMTDSFICVMTHSYVWNDSFPWYFSNVCHVSFICVIWVIHLYVWWPIYTCETIYSHVTWHIHVYVMTLWCVWYDSFMYVTWLMWTGCPFNSTMPKCCVWHVCF